MSTAIHDIHQWENLSFPRSLPEFQRQFPDNAACARYLEGAKWSKGFIPLRRAQWLSLMRGPAIAH